MALHSRAPAAQLALALFGLCLSHSRAARAAVVWTSTFETGDLSEWKPGVNGTNGARQNVEVLAEQVHGGKLAAKVTVHPDDTAPNHQNRVDIQHPSTLTDEGKDMWLSGYYLMPEDAKVQEEIAFCESFVSYQNMLDFWVAPKNGGGTTINFGVGNLGATKLWTADFTPGAWHQLGLHVHWSTDAQQGSVEAWFDGQQVVTTTKAKTKADANALFFQTGIHRRDLSTFTETIYFDDFIEADSLAEMQIATPATGSGGVGGAAGSAGMAGAAGAASGGTAGDGVAGAAVSGGSPAIGGSGFAQGGAGAPASSGAATAGSAGNAVGGEAPAAADAGSSNSASCAYTAAPRRGHTADVAWLLALTASALYRRRN